MEIKKHRSSASLHRAAAGLACALAIGGCGEPPPSGEVSQRATVPRAVGGEHTVTLITGDRVMLRGGSPVVTPGPGRRNVTFMIQRDGDRVVVLPSDVAPLVASGQLDRALFNVTQLLALGYGDDQRDDVPLIITGAGDASGFAQGLAASVRVDRTLPVLHMVTARQAKRDGGAALAGVRALAARTGMLAAGQPPKIWLDGVRRPLLDRSVPQIGGPAAHARGFTGAGITVAVLDGGVDSTHPDLAGKVVAAEDFTGDGKGVLDIDGHGTHVASIIAGTGAASDGQLAGVAPEAQLISGRVCEDFGCPDSAILAGMAWAAAEQHAKIINLSLGGDDTPELDPMEQAVNELSAQLGTLFVIAAGNSGESQSIATPGSADAALTVGAVDRDDALAVFSSRGPRIGDHAIKPDVTAPGLGIVAARPADLPPIGAPVGDFYMRLSGTSMATPHVAGAAALLLQQHPTWSGAELKAQLMASANPNPALDVFAQGAGRIDVDRGTRQAVTAEPAALNLGAAAFPHGDDPPIVRTVRYHNAADAPVTLALAATLTGPAGPGTITVEPAAITVPAAGTAEVVVTAHTDGELADGFYAGALVATGGEVRVETPVAVEREPEMFELTLRAVDRGEAADAFAIITSAADQSFRIVDISGEQTLRLPRGQYAVEADVFGARPTFLIQPRLQLDHDAAITLDTALAETVDVEVGEPEALDSLTNAVYLDRTTGHSGNLFSARGLATGQLGGVLPGNELAGMVTLTLSDDENNAPTKVYNLAHAERGQLPRGWRETIAPSQLATVEAHHAGPAGAIYLRGTQAVFADGDLELLGNFFFLLDQYEGPFDRTELYYGKGLQFEQVMFELRPDPDDPGSSIFSTVFSSVHSYAPGQHLTERWNEAPGGPTLGQRIAQLTDTLQVHSAAVRIDDLVALMPTIIGDRDASHVIGSLTSHTRATLLRDGTKIFERIGGLLDAVLAVPPEPATYRFEVEADRPASVFPRSTHVSAAWTFRSGHVEGERSLPLLTTRFLPALDDNGDTHARVMVLPIAFGRTPGAGTPFVLHAQLEVSFDDGGHWARVPVAAFGDRGLAVIVHPRGAHHVSLRSSATDLAGNSLEQTIVRAYGTR